MNSAQFSAEDWLLLSAHLPQVEIVSIRGSNATDEVMRSFVQHCVRLKWLDVWGNAAVTKIMEDELYSLYPTRKFKVFV